MLTYGKLSQRRTKIVGLNFDNFHLKVTKKSTSKKIIKMKSSQTKLFIGRLADKAINTMTKTIGKNLLHRPTPMVTEARRPLKVQKSFSEDLPQRLAEQRTYRQCLIPDELRVTNKGTVLELRWPEEVEAPPSSPSLTTSSALPQLDAENSQKLETPSANNIAGNSTKTNKRPPTRLLAELLRSQSPSTDVIGSQHLVYGKRGLKIVEVVPMGQYAVRLQFSDSHSGGIFPYDYLEAMGRVGDGSKFRIMRGYINKLRERKKSRNPPKPIKRESNQR